MRTYFAIVHKDEDSAVGVVFPDLPGCFSAGDTYNKAIANAHEALRLYAEAERVAGRQLPKPRTFGAMRMTGRESAKHGRDPIQGCASIPSPSGNSARAAGSTRSICTGVGASSRSANSAPVVIRMPCSIGARQ